MPKSETRRTPLPDRKRTRLFYRWFFSYTSILLIPILFCSYYCIHTYLTVREASIQNQRLLLLNAQNRIDTGFQELAGIATKTQLMNSVISLSNAEPGVLASFQYNYVLSLQKDFHLFQVANDLSLGLSLYFPFGKRILAADTIYTEDLIEHMGNQYFSAADLEFLKQSFGAESESGQVVLFQGSRSGKLYFAKKLTENGGQTRSILIFELNTAHIQNHIFDNYQVPGGPAIALMYNGTCLLSTCPELTFNLLSQEIPLKGAEDLLNYQGRPYIVTTAQSNYPGIELLCLTPQSIYNQQSDYLISVLIITILACLSVGFITTFFYSRKNYRPIRHILDFIEPSAVYPKRENEYELILNQLIHNRTALAEQMEIIHNEFLRKILSGEIQYRQINESVKTKFRFSLTESNSIVAIVHIENFESFQNTVYQKEAAEQPITLLGFIIQNVLTELLHDQFANVHFCFLHSNIAVICNTDLPQEQMADILQYALQRLLDFVLKEYQFSITVGISRIVSDPNALSAAFTQAADALEYIYLFQGEPIYSWKQDAKASLSTPSILGSSETLVNLVLSGSSQCISDYFKQVRKEITSVQVSLEEAKDIVYFFYRTSLQIKARIYRLYGTGSSFAIDRINRGIFHNPLFDVIGQTEDAFLEVCGQLDDARRTRQESLSDRICKYIENNYNDSNLNLNSIALYFNMTPAYLSKRFRAEREESVIDYLYQIRIGHSCRLLESNLKIADIASLVGFQDSNAYIRIFKKEKGITPGKYQEVLHVRKKID